MFDPHERLASLFELQGEHSQPCSIWIYGQQSSFVQFYGHLSQRSGNLRSDGFGADIFGANLHHAWLFAMRRRQNCAEVEVVSQHHLTIGAGEGHDDKI